jgi:xanthine dehydrogenase YagS FAD-binding subunit
MKPFTYQRPSGLEQAVSLVTSGEGGRYLGGGTNLYDLMKDGVESPLQLVDVRFLGLSGITKGTDRSLRIGATTTNSELAANPDTRRLFPAVSKAILSGASGQLRNMATVAGNLLQRTRCSYFGDVSEPCNKRTPGSGCSALEGENHNHAILDWTPACVATHASDMCVALAAFDTRVHYEGPGGPGAIDFADFYLPVADTPHLETALPTGALITELEIPPAAVGANSTYRKVRERASYAFANVSIAAAIDVSDGVVNDVRIALGGVASRPWRARVAEDTLHGGPASSEAYLAAGRAELQAARPLAHNHYKVALAVNLIEAVLSDLTTSTERVNGTNEEHA